MESKKDIEMRTNEIIDEINRLPYSKRMFIIEKTLHTLRINDEKIILEKAAESLYSNYINDKELTSFTNLDFEDFYEAK